MTSNARQDNSQIVVSGRDMFGASFRERTSLLLLDTAEFSFSLFRPVAEDQPIRVNFRPDSEGAENWIDGRIVDVRIRLDGMQTVEVKVLQPATR